MNCVEVLAIADDEIIQEIYDYLYEEDNISNFNDRKQHLISYTIMYHQLASLKEGMGIKRDFVIGYLRERGYGVE